MGEVEFSVMTISNVSSPEIDRWLDQQFARGCSPAALIEAMQTAGYDAGQAQHAVTAADARFRHAQVWARPDWMRDVPNRLDLPGHCSGTGEERSLHIVMALEVPRLVVLADFLMADECEALVAASRHKIKPSLVVDPKSGAYVEDTVRRSQGTHFQHAETALVAGIEARIAHVFGHEVVRHEPMQILHYQVGGEYAAHFDYFDPASPGASVPMARGGQRVATLIMYLSDVEAGGATDFPTLGLSVKPQRGHAVYFENLDVQGRLEPRTLHAGAPVRAGEKWIATKWIRERSTL